MKYTNTTTLVNCFIRVRDKQKSQIELCASWLNDVERDFSMIEKEVLRNSDFQSVIEAMEAIKDFINNDPLFNGKRT